MSVGFGHRHLLGHYHRLLVVHRPLLQYRLPSRHVQGRNSPVKAVAQNCAKTCNLCTLTSYGCLDSSSSCSSWNSNGFCSSSFYDSQTKASYCAKVRTELWFNVAFRPAACAIQQLAEPPAWIARDSLPRILREMHTFSCAMWNTNGFCKNSLYSDSTKRQYCSKLVKRAQHKSFRTCGKCPTSG